MVLTYSVYPQGARLHCLRDVTLAWAVSENIEKLEALKALPAGRQSIDKVV